MQNTPAAVNHLIKSEGLPNDFISTVENYYIPLVHSISQRCLASTNPLVIGVNGAQGTGKSTLALFLAALLEDMQNLSVVQFSLDDLYLRKPQRLRLAKEIHPLLATRGVPGTHDLNLGHMLFESLCSAGEGTRTVIPAFDKATDERLPESGSHEFRGKPDVIIFEGWCVGSVAQPAIDLAAPLNDLERIEDANGVWRSYVNEQLATAYKDLFNIIDLLVFIRAPGWSCIYDWRLLQEKKLKQRLESEQRDTSQLMSERQIARFIQHYERITRHNLKVLPDKTDYLLE
ncbi:MAG: hypothetical protein EX270_08145, partial [Pseudomonadales bacterium]